MSIPGEAMLNKILEELQTSDPQLFENKNLHNVHSLFQPPLSGPMYSCLIKAIVSQRIKFSQSQKLIKQLGKITLETDLSCLPLNKRNLIQNVNEFLDKRPLTEEIVYQLRSIKGIGLWTIQTTLMLCDPLKYVDI